MPKGTRRSISVNGLTYQRLSDYCRHVSRSLSDACEEWIHARLDEIGMPKATTLRSKPKKQEDPQKFPTQYREF